MARHGENIRKRKDGRWEGRYPVYCEEKGRKVYRSVYGKSYAEAKARLTIQKNLLWEGPGKTTEKDRKPEKDGESMLFTDLAEEWLADVKGKRKLSTYTKYSTVYHTHLERTFQGIAISEVTGPLVREKIPDPLSGSIQKSIYCVLNQILKFASTRHSLSLPGLERPTVDVRGKPVDALSGKEQRKLMFSLYNENNIFKTAALLCLYTGLRLGEACALKWTDVDFESGILCVSRTVQRLPAQGMRTKTALMETEPKSACSKREIPLPGAILGLLAKYQDGQAYIFGGRKPMEPRTLQYQFKKILEEAGLPDKHFHTLRHTFATNCIEGGTDVKSLSEMLGHSSVRITLDRYVHPSMETKRKHLDALSSFYGQIYGQAS